MYVSLSDLVNTLYLSNRLGICSYFVFLENVVYFSTLPEQSCIVLLWTSQLCVGTIAVYSKGIHFSSLETGKCIYVKHVNEEININSRHSKHSLM